MPFFHLGNARNAEGFRGSRSPHPAAADSLRSLLGSSHRAAPANGYRFFRSATVAAAICKAALRVRRPFALSAASCPLEAVNAAAAGVHRGSAVTCLSRSLALLRRATGPATGVRSGSLRPGCPPSPGLSPFRQRGRDWEQVRKGGCHRRGTRS